MGTSAAVTISSMAEVERRRSKPPTLNPEPYTRNPDPPQNGDQRGGNDLEHGRVGPPEVEGCRGQAVLWLLVQYLELYCLLFRAYG